MSSSARTAPSHTATFPTRVPAAVTSLSSPGALASSLRPMAPGAILLRLTLAAGGHFDTRALRADGSDVPLAEHLRPVLARWVAADHPTADWREPHDLHLATGLLVPSARSAEGGR